ncbi:uncharacterized protein [Clytia hemisphaerica]
MKVFVFFVCITTFVFGVESKSDDKHLILGGINGRTTAAPTPDVEKFMDVVDGDTLEGEIEIQRGLFGGLQNSIKSVKDVQHDPLSKDDLTMEVQILIDARDGVPATEDDVAVAGLKELKTCIILLKAKAISLESEISHNTWKRLLGLINDLEAEIHDELDYLLEFIHSMDCKLKRTCFNDLHDTSKTLLHKEIQKVGIIGDTCSKFTNECAEKFKAAKMGFTDFMENNIVELKSQLKDIVQLDCLTHASQKKFLQNKIENLEQHALQWIHQLTATLKHLIAFEIDTLSSDFKKTCDKVNTQRLAFKDNKGTTGELNDLVGIKTALGGLSTDAMMITNRFLIAYDVLLHLKGLVDDKEFNTCYDKASELYYLVQGFKLQIDELLASVTKRDVLVMFETKINDFIGVSSDDTAPATGFTKAKEDFMTNLLDLKQNGGIKAMCEAPPVTGPMGINNLADLFESIFEKNENALTDEKTEIESIQSTDLPLLLNCPEFAEKSAQVQALVDEVTKFLKNAEQSKCFAGVFSTNLCGV